MQLACDAATLACRCKERDVTLKPLHLSTGVSFLPHDPGKDDDERLRCTDLNDRAGKERHAPISNNEGSEKNRQTSDSEQGNREREIENEHAHERHCCDECTTATREKKRHDERAVNGKDTVKRTHAWLPLGPAQSGCRHRDRHECEDRRDDGSRGTAKRWSRLNQTGEHGDDDADDRCRRDESRSSLVIHGGSIPLDTSNQFVTHVSGTEDVSSR